MIPMAPTPPSPYELLVGETEQQFSAFWVYVELGSTRTLEEVSKQTTTPHATVARWSTKFGWMQRLLQYENDIYKAAFENRKQLFAQRQQTVHDTGWEDYCATLKEWNDMFAKATEEGKVTPREMKEIMAARLSIEELGRKAVGLPLSYQQAEFQLEEKNKEYRVKFERDMVIPGITSQMPEPSSPQSSPPDQDADDSNLLPLPDSGLQHLDTVLRGLATDHLPQTPSDIVFPSSPDDDA